MARRSTSHHKAEAARLPHHVRLVDRPGGQGQRLNGLLGWCQAEVAAGAWFAHGGAFYFAGPADADRFRVACGGLGVEVVDD